MTQVKKCIIFILPLFLWTSAINATERVIYGEDNRVLLEQSSNPFFKTLAYSTAIMVSSRSLSPVYDGLLFKISGRKLKKAMNMCEDERFNEVLAAGSCSGFLVGPDLLVTAGHCAKTEDECKTRKWIFDFRWDLLKGSEEHYVDGDNVYSCKKLVEQTLDNNTKNDYALILLDRKVGDRPSLYFRTKGKIKDDAKLVVIGHPTGLPTMISDGGVVRKNDHENFFVTNLDTFAGNSGSAVFDSDTGKIEGILVRGERDYIMDLEKKCMRVNKCKSDECRGEDVTRITNIKALNNNE